MKKSVRAFMALLTLLCSVVTAAAAGEITVYYTNDIHTHIDNAVGEENALTYSKIAALKDANPDAILVDAGDHIQGTVYGEMDQGATIVRLMNEAGYDAATLGNHELDYGMDALMDVVEAAEYAYVSSSFYHENAGIVGDTVLDSYVMMEREGKKIAFVGITTPETMGSVPSATFQNENGEFIYGIARGSDGSELYAAIQQAVDKARSAGADYVIALGHLGVDPSSVPWTSRDVIAHTSGLDAFIDGHSHTTIEQELVSDLNGDTVVLTQTGAYLNAVGELTIAETGAISTRLLTSDDLAGIAPDGQVKEVEDAWMAWIEEKLAVVIGYSQVTLDNYDAQGNRLVRKDNSNSGDFVADALYDYFDRMGLEVDVAVMNGGGIRNGAVTGELTYLTCKEIHPFGNVACLIEETGQQLLDMLEWSTRGLRADGAYEAGSFLHVSGMRYTLDLTRPSSVVENERGAWAGAPTGGYRVKNVEILDQNSGTYQPLDLKGTYRLAGYNYILRNLGDGFEMLQGATNVLDYVAEDYMVLASYISSFPVSEQTGVPTITAEHGYSDVHGQGRITILTSAPEQEQVENSCIVKAGDSLWTIAKRIYGTGTKWTAIYEANRTNIADPNLIRVGQQLVLP